jgi:endonuclease/exonuclease/phosphatase (EEP) superfamily protein YafD
MSDAKFFTTIRDLYDLVAQLHQGRSMNKNVRPLWLKGINTLWRYIIASAWVYLTFLSFWILGHLITGDRYVPIALLTMVGPYLFIPLLLLVPLAAVTRRKELIAGVGLGALFFLALYGHNLIPKSSKAHADRTLTVMTFNALGMQGETEPAIRVIEQVDADVVVLQELTPELAQDIEAKLTHRYPFQITDPQPGVTGMGVISRLPLEVNGDELDLNWVGTPQILTLSWEDHQITLIHFHSWAFGLATFEVLEHNFHSREAQAFVLANYARDALNVGPVIAAGDLNAVDRSDAYRTITQVLDDSWQEAGWGFGHTFPGASGPASSRPRIGDWSIPQWLARIDYVFVSEELETVRAVLAPFDGVSDHRAVVVELALMR